MLIHSLKLTNFLSFGSDSKPIELGPLNVLIGPNGSGKSNLIEAMTLMQWAPMELNTPISVGGGVREWLWKGAEVVPTASLEAVVEYREGAVPLRYRLAFTEKSQRFELADERIESSEARAGERQPSLHYGYEDGRPTLIVQGHRRELDRNDLHPEHSILSQRKDPDQYPELTYLGEAFKGIRVYREWSLARHSSPRQPQKADLPNDHLTEGASNLGLVVNRLCKEPAVKRRLLQELRELYEGIEDLHVFIEGGTVQVFISEGPFAVPAARLSDGTLRYLCLLTILCHPNPPALICIEEPELGLHPDVLSSLARLLRRASGRTQLIITTHSDILVDALAETPEAIVVCEKHEGATSMRRLGRDELSTWLEKYSLGELWLRGDLGGTRW